MATAAKPVAQAPAAVAEPASNPAENALSRAQAFTRQFAQQLVNESYPPEETQSGAPDEPEAPAQPAEEPEQPEAETTEESETPETPEQDEESQEEADETEDGATGEAEELPQEIQDSINRRIGKEVAKTKAEREAREAAEAKAAQLEAALSERAPEKEVVRVDSPLAEIGDLGALSKKRQEAEGLRSEVADLLDSVEDAPEEVEAKLKAAGVSAGEYSPREMRRALRGIDSNLKRTLERDIPARETFLKTEAEVKAMVFKQMPDLQNPASEQAKIWRTVLSQVPEIKLNPRWPLFAAALTAYGEAAAKSNGKKPAPAATATGKPAPPKIPAKPKSAPSAASPSQKQQTDRAKLKELMLKGDPEARIQLLQQMLND